MLRKVWECWNQLKQNISDDLPTPPFSQFLTVLPFKIFGCEKVDVAIIEVGLGGTRDSTNVIKNPVVCCGVSLLGMDHMEMLGDTLEQLASHKAGILKPHVPAFTVPQFNPSLQAMYCKNKSFLRLSDLLRVPLEAVAPLHHSNLKGTELSLSYDHQFTNAGLANALCKSWLQSIGNWEKLLQHSGQEDNLPDAFLRGLQTARLSGRAGIVCDSALSSSAMAGEAENTSGDLVFNARWFSSAVKEKTSKEVWGNCNVKGKTSKKILLFSCMDVRDPQSPLLILVDTCASGTHFANAISVPGISTYTKVTSASPVPSGIPPKDLSWQLNLQRVWENIIHGGKGNFHLLPFKLFDFS
ncbi:tetrahydrofolate synthase [Salvia divinorum]|uniref:Tetrahydrofolate synthase n=1 Tax=Salvia divinorum TaxID=28513 RepID=A0ABD1H142_SALDI